MLKGAFVGALAGLMVVGAAQAQPVVYTWTGYGKNVPGSSKCPTYKMVIDVTVDGDSVKGKFQQEGRPEPFALSLIPVASVDQVGLGFRADDHGTASYGFCRRLFTSSQLDPACGSTWYAASRRSSSS